MTLADVVLWLLLAGLVAYLVLAGADFGAGFWDGLARLSPSGDRQQRLIDRSMGPLWEANHVWLIFVLVVLWTCFPVAFGSIMSSLYVPLFLAAVGIICRGAGFAFRAEAGGRGRGVFDGLFAAASLLTPFFLGAAIGGIASGRVPVGNAAGDALTSWWNATSVLIGAVTVVSGIYLAAVYLAADAARGGDRALVDAFRRRALAAGVAAGALALGGLFVLREDARGLYDGLTGDALPLVLVSALAGMATLALIATARYGPARVTGALAVASIVVGWAVAQSPYVLPGELTVEEAAAGRPTLVAVLVAVGVGALILVPSLVLLFRLFLAGRLDKGQASAEGDPDHAAIP